MFDWVLLSFKNYFETDQFTFIAIDEYNNLEFIRERCEEVGIKYYSVIPLTEITSGQAATVVEGIQHVPMDEELFIFNADSFHANFLKADYGTEAVGGLDVFLGEGTHWSFIDPGPDDTVLRTTEKVRISPYCSDGLYYFRSREYFEYACRTGLETTREATGETYIAPLYNQLIGAGHTVKFRLVESSDLYFCGTPPEYAALQELPPPKL